MADKYIRSEDAKDALQEKVFHNLTDEFYGVMQVLDELPPADVVQVRHGRWKYRGVCGIKDNITIRRYKCSECREDIVCDCPYIFCPYCGAKMDGDDKYE